MESNQVPMPGVIELLKQSIDFYKKNYKQLIPIGLVVLVVLIIERIINATLLGSDLSPSKIASLSLIIIILSLIFGIGNFILLILAKINFIRANKEYSSGNVIPTKELYMSSLKLFWPFVWVSILNTMILLGAGIFFLIPAIIIAGYTFLFSYFLVLDNKRGLNALSASFYYVRGNWWKVLWRGLGLGLIFLVLIIIIAIIGFTILHSSGFTFPSSPDQYKNISAQMKTLPGIILTLVYSFIYYCVILPVVSFYNYSIYNHLKLSKAEPNVEADFKKTRGWFMGLSIWSIVVVIGLFAISLASIIFLTVTRGLLKNTQVQPQINTQISIQQYKK